MRDVRTLCFFNQKGGVGKTTSCVCMGAGLARCGYKVLMIDLDGQGSLSVSLGIEPDENDTTVYEVLKGADIRKAIVSKDQYDVLPADIRLSSAELELYSSVGRDLILKKAIKKVSDRYDYVLIDCSPSLTILSIMALTASDEVIVPVKSDYLPLKGMAQLRDTIELVRNSTNPKLEIGGVIVNFYDGKRNLDQEVLASLTRAFGDKVFKHTVRNNVKLGEAPSQGVDIYTYAPTSSGAKMYSEIVKEYLDRQK